MSAAELKELAQLAREQGDTDLELQALEKLNQLQAQPVGALGGGDIGEALGAVEALGTIITGAAAEPISGIAGLVSAPFVGAGRASEIIKETQQNLTLSPRTPEGQRNIQRIGQFLEPIVEALEKSEQTLGDIGFDIGGPIGGAIGASIPTAAIEALGLVAPKAAARVAASRANVLKQTGEEASKRSEALKLNIQAKDLDEVVEQVSRADAGDVVMAADIDPTFIKALDELEIDVEPLASFASQNPQFRQVEQALSAIPGSKLDAQALAFTIAVSNKADELIAKYGGTIDKAELSERFLDESMKTVDNLFKQADDLYNDLDAQIPGETDVRVDMTMGLIESKAKKTKSKIPALFSKVKNQLTVKTKDDLGEVVEELPTYELLSDTRKSIGQALSKKTGPFADAEEGLLKQMYSRLRADQDKAAESLGLLENSKAADALVIQRKALEDNLKTVLGNNLQKSLGVEAGAQIKSLGKGNVKKFNDFIEALPENYRQEAVVSGLNDIFRGRGIDQQAMNVTNFSKFMDELERQPKLKESLYNQLPKGAGKDLDNLAKIAKGISVAQQGKIKTGLVTSLFDNNAGLLRKVIGKGAEITVGGLAEFQGGPLTGSVVREFLSAKTSKAEAVSDLLASDQFRGMMTQAVRDGVVGGKRVSKELNKAEKAFEKSKTYRKWADSLDTDDRAKLASLGLISYMFDEKSEE